MWFTLWFYLYLLLWIPLPISCVDRTLECLIAHPTKLNIYCSFDHVHACNKTYIIHWEEEREKCSLILILPYILTLTFTSLRNSIFLTHNTAHSVNFLSCKHTDLRLIPRTHVGKKRMAIGTENSSAGEVEEGQFLELNGAASLAYMVSSRPLRELASQIQW